MHPNPITGGMSGWASRYWDCCKPACGWKGNVTRGNPMMSCDMSNNSLGGNYDAVNACEGGGTAFMCWSGVPWSADDTLLVRLRGAASGSWTLPAQPVLTRSSSRARTTRTAIRKERQG